MTSTDKTYEWDGAPVVIDNVGYAWLRGENSLYYFLGSLPLTAADLEDRYGPCKAAVLYPATKPEPSVTWRKGVDDAAIREAWKPGRRAQVVTEPGAYTITRDGEIDSYGQHYGPHALEEWLDYGSTASITVWLPETPEVPKWAQDYDTPTDARMVITDDKRAWRPVVANAAYIEKWRWNGNRATEAATTEELMAMGARPLIGPDGKAVL